MKGKHVQASAHAQVERPLGLCVLDFRKSSNPVFRKTLFFTGELRGLYEFKVANNACSEIDR